MTDYARAACLGRWDIYDETITPSSMAGYWYAVTEARKLCRRCPIRAECLADNADNEGVIAGLTYGQRKGNRPACGTEAGATAHTRFHEPRCDACRTAAAKAKARREAS
jgi:hypothetical protein